MFSVSRGMTSPFAKTWIAIALVIAASWGALADDYVTDKLPSPVAKAYFAAVPGNLTARKVARGDAQDTGDDNAYFTDVWTRICQPRHLASQCSLSTQAN